MIETFCALLCAHVLTAVVMPAVGVFDDKTRRIWPAPVVNGAVGLLCTTLCLAPITAVGWGAALAITLWHVCLDMVTSHARRSRLDVFFADQLAHIGIIVTVSLLTPDLWEKSAWGELPPLPAIMAVAAGWIIAAHNGGLALKILMQRWSETVAKDMPSLENGGRIIGQLERSLIFVFLLVDQAEAIGFLIAAKSVLRFGSVKQEAKLSEYVIIGTLASITWAILVSVGTLWLLSHLHTLGIPDITP